MGALSSREGLTRHRGILADRRAFMPLPAKTDERRIRAFQLRAATVTPPAHPFMKQPVNVIAAGGGAGCFGFSGGSGDEGRRESALRDLMSSRENGALRAASQKKRFGNRLNTQKHGHIHPCKYIY